MKRSRNKLLVPAVLVAGAGCTPPQPTGCDPKDLYKGCGPDGGYACPSYCNTRPAGDGGIDYEAGAPLCLC